MVIAADNKAEIAAKIIISRQVIVRFAGPVGIRSNETVACGWNAPPCHQLLRNESSAVGLKAWTQNRRAFLSWSSAVKGCAGDNNEHLDRKPRSLHCVRPRSAEISPMQLGSRPKAPDVAGAFFLSLVPEKLGFTTLRAAPLRAGAGTRSPSCQHQH
jgi:hypothetical protein